MIIKQRINILMMVIIALSLLACGNTRDRENYDPISVALTNPNNHVGGWGRSQCLVCHNVNLNVHRGPNSVIDPEALNAAVRAGGEEAYCRTCHTGNGL